MQKLYLAIIIAVAVAITFTIVTSFMVYSPPEQNRFFVWVQKTTVNYNDTERWSAKGLPPNADYLVTLRWPGVVVILGNGAADTKGEASGSFIVTPNIPSTFTLRVELASDTEKFDEVPINILSSAQAIVLSVEKITVNYNDTERWSAKGLPPNADYLVTLRWPGVVVMLGGGTADMNGEASGSFDVGEYLPSGGIILRVELASDTEKFDEVLLDLNA